VSADIAVSQRGSPPRLLWVLLALSLALNLFFIGGVFWLRTEASHMQLAPAERFEMVARQLSLDATQRAAFDKFINMMRMRTRHLRENNMPLIEETWSELAKAKPDDALIEHNLDEAASNRHAYQLDASRALRAFLAVLSDEQRQTFVSLVKNRENHDVPPLLRQLAP
jgi:Spy/CpxP family protein refolding chaperone